MNLFQCLFAAGGAGMYIKNTLKYMVIEKMSNEVFQALGSKLIILVNQSYMWSPLQTT